MTAPEGWVCDPADPSVGIMGDLWLHDACPLVTEDPSEVTCVAEEALPSGEGVQRFTTITWRLTCADCGATTTFETREWDPDEEQA